MVSCIVVGQSNSVLKEGFASYISISNRIERFKRGAIGSSSAIVAPYFIRPGYCAGYDFVIIDIVMYDYHVIANSNGMYTGYDVGKILEYIIHTVRMDGCQPIILIFAPSWANLKHGWIGDVHRRIARANSCLFFDFCKFISNNFPDRTSDIMSVYSDANHPAPFVQKAIAECLVNFFENSALKLSHLQEVNSYVPIFDVVRTLDVGERDKIIIRRNSLIEERFVIIRKNDRCEINTNGDCWVRGVVINSSSTAGNIIFEGNKSVIKNLSSGKFDEERFVMQVMPIFDDLRPRDGVISVALTEHQPTESHIGTPQSQSSASHAIELSALLVERPNRLPVSYQAYLPDSTSLDIVTRSY